MSSQMEGSSHVRARYGQFRTCLGLKLNVLLPRALANPRPHIGMHCKALEPLKQPQYAISLSAHIAALYRHMLPSSSNGTFILLVCTSSTSPAHLWLFRTPATSCYPHEQTQRLSFTRLHGSLLAEYSHAVGTRYALHPTYASLFGLAMGQSVVGR